MADHDVTGFSQFVSTAPAWGTSGDGYGRTSIMKFHIDIAALEAELATTIGSTDVLHLWDIPIGVEIRKVMIVTRHLDTAAGGVTVSCGDTTSAAAYCAATALPAVGSAIGSATTTDAYAIVGGRLYVAANILHLTFGTAVPAGAIFDVYVLCSFIDYA
jgi:hypothetical protein